MQLALRYSGSLDICPIAIFGTCPLPFPIPSQVVGFYSFVTCVLLLVARFLPSPSILPCSMQFRNDGLSGFVCGSCRRLLANRDALLPTQLLRLSVFICWITILWSVVQASNVLQKNAPLWVSYTVYLFLYIWTVISTSSLYHHNTDQETAFCWCSFWPSRKSTSIGDRMTVVGSFQFGIGLFPNTTWLCWHSLVPHLTFICQALGISYIEMFLLVYKLQMPFVCGLGLHVFVGSAADSGFSSFFKLPPDFKGKKLQNINKLFGINFIDFKHIILLLWKRLNPSEKGFVSATYGPTPQTTT